MPKPTVFDIYYLPLSCGCAIPVGRNVYDRVMADPPDEREHGCNVHRGRHKVLSGGKV